MKAVNFVIHRLRLLFLIFICPVQITFAQSFKQLSDSTRHYAAKGDYYQAIKWCETLLKLAEKEFGKNDTLYADALTTMVELSYHAGKFEEVIGIAKEEIEIRKKIQGEKNPKYGGALNNLAEIYRSLGYYTQAEELYLQAKEILKIIYGEYHPDYATLLNNMAELYRNMGRFTESEELFKLSKEIRKEKLGETHPDYATSLNNLAVLYRSMKRYSQAEEMYLSSIEIRKLKLGESHPYYAQSLNNLADLYAIMGLYQKAEILLTTSKEIFKNKIGENNPYYALTLNNLAVVNQSMGKFNQSEELFLISNEIWRSYLGENHPEYAISLNNIAGLYEAAGNYGKAIDYYHQNIQKILFLIDKYFIGLSEKEKSQFYNMVKIKFEHYYYFGSFHYNDTGNWQMQIPETIFQYRFATKGILFNSSNKIRENILGSNDTSLIDTYKKWQNKRDFLAKLYSKNKNEINKLNVSFEVIENEINDLEKKLSLKSEMFENRTGLKEPKWQDVQLNLKEDECFIEMIRFRKYGTIDDTIRYNDSSWTVKKVWFTDTVYYAALILFPTSKGKGKFDSSHVKLIIFENGNELEEKYYAGYKLAVKHLQPYDEGYVQYWEKIAKELQGIKTVYFSADGVYNQINLNTLQNPQTGKYLLEELNIRLITSSKDLLKIQNPESKILNSNLTASLYGYVNYDNNIATENIGELTVLNGTKTEITNIEILLKEKNWSVNSYKWKQATESSLKMERSPSILHIATHGYFLNEENRKGKKILGIDSIYFGLNSLLNSGLILSVDVDSDKINSTISGSGLGLMGKEEDGILTAYEAMNLTLDNTELVVLSACETGLGNVVHGEGVYGLQRAFHQAGAKSVIMSLWKVPDNHTQELMSLFYTKWLNGMQKSEAFRNAQEEMKNNYVHPYYWGGFVLVGN